MAIASDNTALSEAIRPLHTETTGTIVIEKATPSPSLFVKRVRQLLAASFQA